MHTLLALSSLLLVVLGGYAALFRLRRLRGWSRRRDVQLLVLGAPVVSLGLGIGAVHHFTGRTCLLGAPPWDYVLGVALPLAMGLVALGALGLGLVRLALLRRVVGRAGALADPQLQALVDRLADGMGLRGARRPRLRLCVYHRPLAFTTGLFRPAVLLSAWMVEHLDERELESVLAHELGHVARRDWLVTWLALVLRDAFFYLPTSWAAYRQLRHEKELACDDATVAATRRPLALASALAKVWQVAMGDPFGTLTVRRGVGAAAVQPLIGEGATRLTMEARIERLLETPGPVADAPRPRALALSVGAAALAGLLVVQAANAAVMLAPMGCGPASFLGQVGWSGLVGLLGGLLGGLV